MYKPSVRMMLSATLVLMDAFQGGLATCQTPSSNYLQLLTLPRSGETNVVPSSALDRVVEAHNHRLTQNPAPRNRNRIVYLNGPDSYKPVAFPVEPRALLVDGSGKMMGHFALDTRTVQINFGQHKLIGGVDHVMVFAAHMEEPVTGTGWITLNELSSSPQKAQFASELAMNVKDDPEGGDSPEKYLIHCGSPEGWDDGRLKILPNVSDRENRHEAATDYLRRPGGFCYLLSSLPGHGGVAADVFSDGPLFVPTAGVPRVEVPIYLPKDATSEEGADWKNKKLPHEMEFRYGRIGDRYGWIPSADLAPVIDQGGSPSKFE